MGSASAILSAASVWGNAPSRLLRSDGDDVGANNWDVEGYHRLGQPLQYERAKLLGFNASFERRVNALAEQDLAVLGLSAKTCGDITHRADRSLAGAIGKADLT